MVKCSSSSGIISSRKSRDTYLVRELGEILAEGRRILLGLLDQLLETVEPSLELFCWAQRRADEGEIAARQLSSKLSTGRLI